MFPFQRSCELSFKVEDHDNNEDNSSNQPNNLQDHIVFDNNALVGVSNINLYNHNTNINTNRGQGGRGRGRGRGRGGRRSISLGSSSSSKSNNVDEDEKRVLHRDVERQRRFEMSTLFDSLRNVIPYDRLKGRKSITDHLEEATNYIKDLEKNVKELGEKRDILKQAKGSTNTSYGNNELGGSSGSSTPYSVAIRPLRGGLDIQICVKYDDDEFMLSNALQVAIEEGLDVVSSTSTKLHDSFIHSIQCEIKDITRIDLNRLEQRLNGLF